MDLTQNIESKGFKLERNDSIDMKSVAQAVFAEWKLFFIVVLFFVLLAVSKVLLTKEVYEARVDIVNPSSSQIYPLTSLKLFDQISPDGVTVDFLRKIQSPEFVLRFIESSEESKRIYGEGLDSQLIERFKKRIEITGNNARANDRALFPYTVFFQGYTPEESMSELERLIRYAESELLTDYVEKYAVLRSMHVEKLDRDYQALEGQLNSVREFEVYKLEESQRIKLLKLEDELKVAKDGYQNMIRDRVHALTEAYNVAKSLGIKDPLSRGQVGQADRASIAVSISEQEDPLYLLGTRLLGAEIAVLKERSFEGYPSPQIRQIEKSIQLAKNDRSLDALKQRENELAYSQELQRIGFEKKILEMSGFPENVELNFMYANAFAGSNPKGASGAFIVLLSLLIGGVVGVLVVLFKRSWCGQGF